MDYAVQQIPMEQIWHDTDFNMRGYIPPLEVIDLSKDIAARGLDQPITVQPYSNPDNPNIKYRIVAGHRRHRAFQVNNAETIPAFVRPDLDEISSRMHNLRENVQRQSTNIMQEAKHIQFFLDKKMSENEIANQIGQSKPWVQIRVALLKLPKAVQEVAASGVLTQEQIKRAAQLVKDPAKLNEFIRKIKDAKIRGETVRVVESVSQAKNAMKAKSRNRSEIVQMLKAMYDALGPNLATRALAWASGEISTVSLYNDMKKQADAEGIPFEFPEFIRRALTHSHNSETEYVEITRSEERAMLVKG